MVEYIENEFLRVAIDSIGAQMQSIQTMDGTEYLWQGDENTWKDRALNLFPYIARLTGGTYKYNGKLYQMEPHGFVWKSELSVKKESPEKICFILEANEETKKEYPFEFSYCCEYELVGWELKITYRVKNLDSKKMYFGIGGHPGFQVPIGVEGTFSDYELRFGQKAEPYRIGMSESCFVTGQDSQFRLEENQVLPLRHSLFDEDAIILRNMAKTVTLQSHISGKKIHVTYPEMDYLGIWHWPKSEAAYVCIEPWSSLPSRDGIVEELTQQENLVQLEAGEEYVNQWKITMEDVDKNAM